MSCKWTLLRPCMLTAKDKAIWFMASVPGLSGTRFFPPVLVKFWQGKILGYISYVLYFLWQFRKDLFARLPCSKLPVQNIIMLCVKFIVRKLTKNR